jgi:hypothetical protein
MTVMDDLVTMMVAIMTRVLERVCAEPGRIIDVVVV